MRLKEADNVPRGYQAAIKNYRQGFNSGRFGADGNPNYVSAKNAGNTLFDKYDRLIKQNYPNAQKEFSTEFNNVENKIYNITNKLADQYRNRKYDDAEDTEVELFLAKNELRVLDLIKNAAQFNLDESLNEQLYRFSTVNDDGTPGVSIVATSQEEAQYKLERILNDRINSRIRPLDEIDEIATQLYNDGDDFSFHLFSDEELAMLFANAVNGNAPYDDEVFEAISNFPNSDEIFDRARELAREQKSVNESIEDYDDFEESNWIKIASKPIKDYDGFLTDYTMYQDANDENHFVFVYGDADLYRPEDEDWDWEAFSQREAEEWFDDYQGFDDEGEREWPDAEDEEDYEYEYDEYEDYEV